MLVTKPLAQKLREAKPSPRDAVAGLKLVEELCALTMAHKTQEAAKLAAHIVASPHTYNAVLAMAIGVICSAEMGLVEAHGSLTSMQSDEPESFDKLVEHVAAQMGVPIERVKKIAFDEL